MEDKISFVVESNEAPIMVHGRLLEGVHISGYSFQRALAKFKWLLEDNRWKKCGFTKVKDFVRSVDYSGFRISDEERLEFARACVDAGASRRSAADALGLAHETINRDFGTNAPEITQIREESGTNVPVRRRSAAEITKPEGDDKNLPPTDPAATDDAMPAVLDKPPLTPSEKAARTRTAHETIAKFAFDQPASHVPAGEPIRLGDFYTMASELKDDSVDLIFTDPPYDDKSIPLFGRMGEVAARVLKPGGSLVTYLGHMQLIEAGNLLSRHLRFWHPLCCLHSGPFARMTEFGVVETFKPMLWFVKGTRGDKHSFVESAVTGSREKDHHEWQQAESEAEYFISVLSPPSGLVVDFFAGGGTTIVAAQRLGRNALGYEIDQNHHKKALERIRNIPSKAAAE